MAKISKVCKIIVFIFVFGILPVSVSAANLSVSPASDTFEVGDKMTVKVMVSSTAPINAISGNVSFPTDLFSIESVSKSGSILNFWVSEPSISRKAGTVLFEGVTLGGFGGASGTVVSVKLKALKEGTGKVSFKDGKILANDGEGTDVTGNLNSATYSITPKKQVEKTKIPKAEKVVPEVVEKETPQAPATLTAPEIELISKFGEQAIHGTSKYKEAQVLTTFVSKDGVKIFITGDTDTNGEFIELVPKTLKRGLYDAFSVVVLKDFTHTYESNKIEIEVGNFFSDISLEIRISLLILSIILLILIFRSLLYLKKNKKFKSFVHQEAHEAEDLVHKSFKVLNEDADEALGKKISASEKEFIKDMKKDLRQAEDIVTKEIKGIEKS